MKYTGLHRGHRRARMISALRRWRGKFSRSYKSARKLYRSPWHRRTAYILCIIVILAYGLSNIPFNKAKAGQGYYSAAGKGVLGYSDGTTTPKTRKWSPGAGSTGFGGETSTVSSRNALQSVTKSSVKTPNDVFMAVADASANLQVLRSTDGGTTWASSLAAATIGSIGGTGTSRRFDMEFESNSGQLVLAYSKNATTNEIGFRVWDGSSWSSETTWDPSGTASVVTWIEMTPSPRTDEITMGYITNDATNNDGAGIWNGTNNSATSPTFATSLDLTETTINSMAFDPDHGILYAGTATNALIYRCDTTTLCDASGDWTQVYDVTAQGAISDYVSMLYYDTVNNAMYAGSGSADGTYVEHLYRCDTTTLCDASGDWSSVYTGGSGESAIYGMVTDTTNNVLYMSSGWDGYVLRCPLSNNCDAQGDWSASLNYRAKTGLGAGVGFMGNMSYDATNQVIYLGTGFNGIIYRCAVSTSCDADADWTVSIDTASTSAYTMAMDTDQGVLYVGGDNGTVYRCSLSTACDASGDWTSYAGGQAQSLVLIYDSVGKRLFQGTGTNGILQECYTTTNCDAAADWSTAQDTTETSIYSGVIDTTHNIGYFGTDLSGLIKRCDLTTSCSNTDTAALGACDQTTSATGLDKCIDVNYEWGTGSPVMSWGINGAGNAASLLRATRWNGVTWTTNTITLGSLGDDVTQIDCDSKPDFSSDEIACISVGNGSDDTQAWTVKSGVLGVAGANLDTAVHLDAQGHQLVSLMYLKNGNVYRAYGVWADGAADAAATAQDYTVFNGTAWAAAASSTTLTYATQEENIQSVVSTGDQSQGIFLVADASNDLYAAKYAVSSTGTLTISAADGGSALETALASLNGTPVSMAFDGPSGPAQYNIDGSIWENDDGTTADTNTQVTGANTALTDISKGQRLTLRTQLRNTGSMANNEELSLFYDKNDGIWQKVRARTPAETTTGSCTDTNWNCGSVDTANTTYATTPIVWDKNGHGFMAFMDDTANKVWIAQYTGNTAGSSSGCAANSGWTCYSIITDATGIATTDTIDMALDPAGNPMIVYSTGNALHYAQYVAGTGGTGCTSNTAWTCGTLNSTGGINPSIAIDNTGEQWIAFFDSATSDLKVARSGSSGGTNCTATAWQCESVQTTNLVGDHPSVVVDQYGIPRISYYDSTNGSLRMATYVGINGTGCVAATWQCEDVDAASADVGNHSSINLKPDGTPAIAYYDNTNKDLYYASFVGSGGTGCTNSTFRDNWSCTKIDDTIADVGQEVDMSMDAAGNPWITYLNVTNSDLRLAHYVGTGGSGCASGVSAAWTCVTVDSSNASGFSSGITFDPNGVAWISYVDNGSNHDLRYARYAKTGEIVVNGGAAGITTPTISASHADMANAGDSGNKSDADCITTAAAWNNGTWTAYDNATLSMPGGRTTAQCTEVSFVVDTSQASDNTTYRFLVAQKDDRTSYERRFTGPVSAANGYASLTTSVSSSDRLTKGTFMDFSNCTDTSWGCNVIKSAGSAGDKHGKFISLAFDSNNTPWVSWYGELDLALYSAHYVGSGGNCTDTAWICEKVDETTSDVGGGSSIAVDTSGKIWISYQDGANGYTRVATYVGGGGGNCTDTDWDCYTVNTNQSGEAGSITIGPDGKPWITSRYYNNDAAWIARYVGTGGTGCGTNGSSAWSCELFDDSAGATTYYGNHPETSFDKFGVPWVVYPQYDFSIRVAHRTGDGAGTSCAQATRPKEWQCDQVVSHGAGGTWEASSIAFNASNIPYFSYFDSSAGSLNYSKYTGTGTESSCGGGAQQYWKCEVIDDVGTTGVGQANQISFDINGNPWISYYDIDNTAMKVAHYVGTGGSGCTGSTTAGAWSCTTVDSNAVGVTSLGTSDGFQPHFPIVFDKTGTPWIAYFTADTDSSAKVAKLHLPQDKLVATNQYYYNTRSASTSESIYRTDVGRALTSNQGTCASASADKNGTCGLFANEGYYDGVVGASAAEQPLYTGAFKATNTTELPTVTWVGKSSLAPNTASTAGDIIMQIYRFGSTNAWETLASNTTSSDCSSDNCTLSAQPSGTLADYFETVGSENWVYVRVYQVKSSSAITFKTDTLHMVQTLDTLKHGRFFRNGIRRPTEY